MKRSEVISHIAEELEYMGVRVPGWSRESQESFVTRRAADMLDMLEAEGMLPPLNEQNYHHMDNDDRITANKARFIHSWEPEDET